MNRHRACRRWDGASAWHARLVLHRTHWFQAGKKPRSWFVSVQVCPKLHLAVPPGKKATLEVALLDLVGRHWSGCSPLHSSEVLLGELAQGSAGRCLRPTAGRWSPCLAGPPHRRHCLTVLRGAS